MRSLVHENAFTSPERDENFVFVTRKEYFHRKTGLDHALKYDPALF
jgi:hypothetical protein